MSTEPVGDTPLGEIGWALSWLDSHHVQDNLFRLGAIGADDIRQAVSCLNRAVTGLKEANREHAALTAKLESAEREVAELRKDKERLDWLEAQTSIYMTRPFYMCGGGYMKGKFREAIDAREAATKGAQEGGKKECSPPASSPETSPA